MLAPPEYKWNKKIICDPKIRWWPAYMWIFVMQCINYMTSYEVLQKVLKNNVISSTYSQFGFIKMYKKCIQPVQRCRGWRNNEHVTFLRGLGEILKIRLSQRVISCIFNESSVISNYEQSVNLSMFCFVFAFR